MRRLILITRAPSCILAEKLKLSRGEKKDGEKTAEKKPRGKNKASRLRFIETDIQPQTGLPRLEF